MKFIYKGEDERVFPTLSLVVAPGDTFEAPDDFDAPNVLPATKSKTTSKESE